MSSTNVVNFSLRQNKCIERSLVFDGLSRLLPAINVGDAAYVGLGSVWFSDFQLAHRVLGIRDMVSVEEDEVTYRRATYNKPYRTLSVLHGRSDTMLPALLEEGEFAGRPWVVWLDYDKALVEDRLTELRRLVESLVPNSVLITTFSASPNAYGRPGTRRERVLELLGDAVDGVLNDQSLDGDELARVLAGGALNFIKSVAIQSGRSGGFVPGFSIRYRDGAPMVTVGGLLPDEASVSLAEALLKGSDWFGFVADPIAAPPLTSREIMALQAALPADTPLTRGDLQAWGFDLSEEALGTFSKHYLRFPSFAQVIG
jgi:hypothetical protein